jgi:hypothetical protein
MHDYLIIRLGFVFILVAGILFIVSCSNDDPAWKLEISDPRNEISYYSIPVSPGDRFTLSYRHSVSGSEVSGIFQLTGDGKIRPMTTTFSSFGPGLPLDSYEIYSIENGMITVFHEEEPRDEIRIWVTPMTEETIIISNHKYPLYRFAEDQKLFKINLAR